MHVNSSSGSRITCPCQTARPPMADAPSSNHCSYPRSSCDDDDDDCCCAWEEVERCRSSDFDDCADESSSCHPSSSDMEYSWEVCD